jgi:hypothetical protein
MSSQSSLKLSYTAGIGIRNQIESAILKAAHDMDVDININTSKGWFVSTYYITIKGETEKIKRLKVAIEKWYNDLANGYF